jgi:dolichol-phosphate mannosyltransferase
LIATLETLPAEHSRRSNFLLSAIVPCFNEENVISLTYHRLIEVIGTRDFRLQMVFVDDGSEDLMPETIMGFSKDQAAVSAGLANADGDAVVVIDADLHVLAAKTVIPGAAKRRAGIHKP